MQVWPIYQVDAFSTELFQGNPAAVIPLPDSINQWPDDDLLQKIAEENNLPETEYLLSQQDDWQIRWFTPTAEVPLCGHATLASAYVIFSKLQHPLTEIQFSTLHAGDLFIKKKKQCCKCIISAAVNKEHSNHPAAAYDCDFVSRFFAPSFGVNEDPVTGSAHCALVPYRARLLGKNELKAMQIGPRGARSSVRIWSLIVLAWLATAVYICAVKSRSIE